MKYFTETRGTLERVIRPGGLRHIQFGVCASALSILCAMPSFGATVNPTIRNVKLMPESPDISPEPEKISRREQRQQKRDEKRIKKEAKDTAEALKFMKESNVDRFL